MLRLNNWHCLCVSCVPGRLTGCLTEEEKEEIGATYWCWEVIMGPKSWLIDGLIYLFFKGRKIKSGSFAVETTDVLGKMHEHFCVSISFPAAAALLSAVDKMAGHRKFPELEHNLWELQVLWLQSAKECEHHWSSACRAEDTVSCKRNSKW